MSKETIIKYKYVDVEKWNYNDFILNRTIKNNDKYYGGNCVILSVLVCHYLYVSNDTLYNVYMELANLSDHQLLELIHNYSNSIYNIITQN